MATTDYFESYEEWHEAITQRCGLDLTEAYCDERIRALGNRKDPATRAFLDLYGEAYLGKVVSWFGRARNGAGR